MTAKHSAWDFVDGILVINLDSSPERMALFRQRNADVLPMEKVHRISAVYGRSLPTFGKEPWFTERTKERAGYWGGVAGCTLSHRRAIEYARAAGWRNVLILEDDVQVHSGADGLDLLERSLGELSGPYILYLGYSRPTPYGRRVLDVGRHALWCTEGVLSTFAYLVSRELYDTLLAGMPTEENVWEWHACNRAVDTFYRDRIARTSGVKIYVIQPDLVDHIDGQSDVGSDTRTDTYSRTQTPLSYATPAGLLHLLTSPLRGLKIRLNSIRTARRARKGGFPGYRKKRKK